MTPAERLNRLVDYDLWANLKILALLEDYPSFDHREKTLHLFYHIIGTQHHWHGRVVGADLSDIKVWPELELEDCRNLIKANYTKLKNLVGENEGELDRGISYKNSSGTAYTTTLSDILHHVVIHGQHHRSQIAMLLRMSEIAPPPTDFIFYTREQNG